jgi:hypothetical protein
MVPGFKATSAVKTSVEEGAMKIDGCCHCGYITYEAEIDPEKVMICHCTDCQTLSGSAFRTVALTREGTFKLLSGELKIYVKTGENGTKRPQSFCPECGTPIYSTTVGKGPKVPRHPRRHRPPTRSTRAESAALVSLLAKLAK